MMQRFTGTQWSPGDTILSRQILKGQVWAVFPEYVVHDDGDLLITYIQTGSEFGFPSTHGLDAHPWQGRYTHWTGHGSLSFARQGEPWGFSTFWTGDNRKFDCWYVDLMAPYSRFEGGVDSLDHELDLVIHPDGTIEEKDVDLFEQEVRDGRFDPELADQIRANFSRIKHLLTTDGVPYEREWQTWEPPADWGALALPQEWQDLAAPAADADADGKTPSTD